MQQACKLNLTVSLQHKGLWYGAEAMMQASEGLSRLKTLVLSSDSWNNAWQSAYNKEQLLFGVTIDICSNP